MVLEPVAHHGSMFRSRRADRLKLLYWDDKPSRAIGSSAMANGLVMACKRLENASFTWPAIKDGVMMLNHARFEALFARLDWRKVKALDVRLPATAEWINHLVLRAFAGA